MKKFSRPPLTAAQRQLSRFVSSEHMSRIFDPMIADVQHLWREQREAGHRLGALGMRVRAQVIFAATFLSALARYRGGLMPAFPWGVLLPALALSTVGVLALGAVVAPEIGGLGADIAGQQRTWLCIGLAAFAGGLMMPGRLLRAWRGWACLGGALLVASVVAEGAPWMRLGGLFVHGLSLALPALIFALAGLLSRPGRSRWITSGLAIGAVALIGSQSVGFAAIALIVAAVMMRRTAPVLGVVFAVASMALIAPMIGSPGGELLPHTDGVLPAVFARFGAPGLGILLGLAALVFVGLQGARRRSGEDSFAGLAALGVMALWGAQAALHIAGALGWMSPVGASFPLVSYGGTSMVTLFFMMGLTASAAANPAPVETTC